MAFIQLHLLRTLPFSNPNRDEMGRPKSGVFGGVERLRLTSQSIKRAIRDADIFRQHVTGTSVCNRTRTVPRIVAEAMRDAGISQDLVEVALLDLVGKIMTVNAAPKPKDGTAPDVGAWLETVISEEVVFMTEEEIDRLVALCIRTAQTITPKEVKAEKKKKSGTEDENAPKATFGLDATLVADEIFSDQASGVDIAMFGRMMAKVKSTKDQNVDGACQVNHAVTTHRAVAEEDYYTALDDLDNNGAAMIGHAGFGSGTYYSYFCIDTRTLLSNLGGDEDMTWRAIEGFLRAAILTLPNGKRTSFAHATLPFHARLEVGTAVNRSLVDAFTAPVIDEDIQGASVGRLEDLLERQARVYGTGDLRHATLSTLSDESDTVEDLIALAKSVV